MKEARVDDIQLDFVQQALIHEEQKQKGNTQNSDTSVGRQDSGSIGLASHQFAGIVRRLDTFNATAPRKEIQDFSTQLRLRKKNLLTLIVRVLFQCLMIY